MNGPGDTGKHLPVVGDGGTEGKKGLRHRRSQHDTCSAAEMTLMSDASEETTG